MLKVCLGSDCGLETEGVLNVGKVGVGRGGFGAVGRGEEDGGEGDFGVAFEGETGPNGNGRDAIGADERIEHGGAVGMVEGQDGIEQRLELGIGEAGADVQPGGLEERAEGRAADDAVHAEHVAGTE